VENADSRSLDFHLSELSVDISGRKYGQKIKIPLRLTSNHICCDNEDHSLRLARLHWPSIFSTFDEEELRSVGIHFVSIALRDMVLRKMIWKRCGVARSMELGLALMNR
jgi:hypothetical protein